MHFLSSRIFSIIVNLLVLLFFYDSAIATESNTIQNIIKIKTYISNSNGSFSFVSYGSAISIGSSRILTNAHVILGTDDEPTWLYEICFSTDFEKVPVCQETARLIAYDTVADLAILELSHTISLNPFSLSSSKLAIGSYVSMYGYPGIGGETITRTEWKIAGFEQTMYKIDGSIDHGNSGGGAFNNSWELVGIPTAVASDNASIGYMIPIKRIQEFLSKRTNNYEIYTHKINNSFLKFVQKNQSYRSDIPLFKWNDLIVKNPRRYGFALKSAMVSSDNTMVNWSFSDSYDRVHFTISCTDDAGGITGWQARMNWLITEKKLYPTWSISSIDENDFFTVFSWSKWYKAWVTLYFKKYDACYADIDYLDSRKDTKSLNKAINFLKKEVSFYQKYTLRDSHDNQYFKIEHTPKDVRVIRSIDSIGTESVILGLEIVPWQWINATIEWKEYPALSDLWVVLGTDFAEANTWQEYITLGIKNGIEPSKIQNIELGTDQKWILFSSYNSDKKMTTLVFEYTYKTQDNKYAYWTWSAAIKGDQNIDIDRVKKLFTWLIYPGKSFLVD